MVDALSDDRYISAVAEYEEAPLFLRIRYVVLKSPMCKDFPFKLAFAMPIKNPTDGQTPTPEELEELNAVEDTILEEVNHQFEGLHCLTLTTGKMREVVFYVKPKKDAVNSAKDICSKIRSYTVQAQYAKESDWSSFKYFTESVSLPS